VCSLLLLVFCSVLYANHAAFRLQTRTGAYDYYRLRLHTNLVVQHQPMLSLVTSESRLKTSICRVELASQPQGRVLRPRKGVSVFDEDERKLRGLRSGTTGRGTRDVGRAGSKSIAIIERFF